MSTTIRAAVVWERGGPFEITELELDEPRPDEILVRNVASGICHTDASAREGKLPVRFPIVLGHEGAGVVERVGSQVREVAPGDRVLLLPDYCGRCPQCVAGHGKYCDNALQVTFSGREPDGSARARGAGRDVGTGFFGQSSFASHSLVHERNVLTVGAEAPLEQLAALTCGVQTGAGAMLHSIPVHVGDRVLVLGAGAVGLSAVMAANAAGAGEIVLVDRVAHRLKLGLELGATHVIDTGETPDLGAEIRRVSGAGCTVALDTTGVPELVRIAVQSLGTYGSCGIVTTGGGDLVIPPGPMVTRGASVRGILGGDAPSALLVAQLIELHARGAFDYERLIRPYPFEKINDALADSLGGDTIKPVLLH